MIKQIRFDMNVNINGRKFNYPILLDYENDRTWVAELLGYNIFVDSETYYPSSFTFAERVEDEAMERILQGAGEIIE